ncbi:hypothetical protein [Pseudomonas sp. LB3P38]|uniref:hypothetical protein n=1 Tax=Pseudomonas lyxosi TaxID=3398358 RepID=UPI0039EEAD8A
MREADHDCVQSNEDFTDFDHTVDVAPTTDDSTNESKTTDTVYENKGSGLDSLGGGRLI